VPAAMTPSTSSSAFRRPRKSLHRPMIGPEMAPARKNMDWTCAMAAESASKSAPIWGRAGVTMLALSWKERTPRRSVVMRMDALGCDCLSETFSVTGDGEGGVSTANSFVPLVRVTEIMSCYTTMYDEQVQRLFPNHVISL
jgi:hypothetical protein